MENSSTSKKIKSKKESRISSPSEEIESSVKNYVTTLTFFLKYISLTPRDEVPPFCCYHPRLYFNFFSYKLRNHMVILWILNEQCR